MKVLQKQRLLVHGRRKEEIQAEIHKKKRPEDWITWPTSKGWTNKGYLDEIRKDYQEKKGGKEVSNFKWVKVFSEDQGNNLFSLSMTYVCHGMQGLKLHLKIQVRHQGSFLRVQVVKGWKSCLVKVMASLSLKNFENRFEICLPGIHVRALLYSAKT